MFEVKVRRAFKATHALYDCRGKSEEPHEHEWKCEVSISSKKLDESGCVIDFNLVDKMLDEILIPIEGSSLNETGIIPGVNPSAENVAKHVFEKLSAMLKDGKCRIAKVGIWEDENHGASYAE